MMNIFDKVISVIYPDYDSYSIQKQELIRDDTSFYVRKTGHFGEYAILGLLVATLMLTFGFFRKKIKKVYFGETVGIIYAITDEAHQGFVEGRSPGILDVFIDSVGTLCGITAAVVILLVANNKRKKIKY